MWFALLPLLLPLLWLLSLLRLLLLLLLGVRRCPYIMRWVLLQQVLYGHPQGV
jgi:hypothetical protein